MLFIIIHLYINNLKIRIKKIVGSKNLLNFSNQSLITIFKMKLITRVDSKIFQQFTKVINLERIGLLTLVISSLKDYICINPYINDMTQ